MVTNRDHYRNLLLPATALPYEAIMCRVKPRIAQRFSSDHERTLQPRLRTAGVDGSYRDHDTVITALKAENKGEKAIN